MLEWLKTLSRNGIRRVWLSEAAYFRFIEELYDYYEQHRLGIAPPPPRKGECYSVHNVRVFQRADRHG